MNPWDQIGYEFTLFLCVILGVIGIGGIIHGIGDLWGSYKRRPKP